MHKEKMRFLHFTTQLTPAVYLSVRKQWGAKMDLVALNKNTMVTITGKNIHSEFFPRWCWLLVCLMWIYATVLKVTNINFLPLSLRNIMIIITLPILKSDKNNTFFVLCISHVMTVPLMYNFFVAVDDYDERSVYWQ